MTNIIALYKDALSYKSLNYYKFPLDTEDTINLLYINGNHFKLLYAKNIKGSDKVINTIIENEIENYPDNNSINKFLNKKNRIKKNK